MVSKKVESITYTDKNGYLRFINTNKLFHRWIMEKKLVRPLREDELVHHINGNKKDNRPENLEVLTAQEHYKLHVVPLLDARREAQIVERLEPIFEHKAIKFSYLLLALFGAVMLIGGLITRQVAPIWLIGLILLITGLVVWFILVLFKGGQNENSHLLPSKH